MTTTNFLAFRAKVRDWSNRDAGALPDAVIDDALNFAEDEALRRLKIPPLEQNQYYYVLNTIQVSSFTTVNEGIDYTINDVGDISASGITTTVALWVALGAVEITEANISGASGVVTFTLLPNVVIPTGFTGTVFETVVPANIVLQFPNVVGVDTFELGTSIAFGGEELRLPVPADTTTFLQLRIVASSSAVTRGIVFNEKVDVRTYYDSTAFARNQNRWMRQGANLHVVGEFSPGDTIELYYYRRPPNVMARYEVTTGAISDYNLFSESEFIAPVADVTVFVSSAGLGDIRRISDTSVEPFISLIANNTTEPSITSADWELLPTLEDPATTGVFFYGLEVFNWLRDENVRILLFGALYQCFDYLADHEMKGNFFEKFAKTIEELNEEEKKRTASGGNVQVNYSSQLLSNYLI